MHAAAGYSNGFVPTLELELRALPSHDHDKEENEEYFDDCPSISTLHFPGQKTVIPILVAKFEVHVTLHTQTVSKLFEAVIRMELRSCIEAIVFYSSLEGAMKLKFVSFYSP